jgi:hypothetical protein
MVVLPQGLVRRTANPFASHAHSTADRVARILGRAWN